MSELTLPGDTPGLLQRGSPIVLISRFAAHEHGDRVYREWVSERARLPGHRQAVAQAVDGGVALVSVGLVSAWQPLTDVALDLTDATGRAHAAWWLARRVLAAEGAPANDGQVHASWLPCVYSEHDAWSLHIDVRRAGIIDSRGRPWGPTDVPALAALRLGDSRLLPDGSYRVDAEALRVVCLHVAGRAP